MSRPEQPIQITAEQFAQIPFALIDTAALGGHELLVYLALRRHANAARECYPSLDRIAAVARLSRVPVWRAIKRLEAAGWVVRKRIKGDVSGYHLPSRDMFPEETKPISVGNTPPISVGNTELDIRTELDNYPAGGPAQKQKAPAPDPGVRTVIDAYAKAFEARFKRRPVIEGGKDGSLIRTLVRQHGTATVLEFLDRFFVSEDKFILGSGYTLGVFKSQFNKLIVEAAPRRRRYVLPEGPNYDQHPAAH